MRIYYAGLDGAIGCIAIEGSGEWNLLELNSRDGSVCRLGEHILKKLKDNDN